MTTIQESRRRYKSENATDFFIKNALNIFPQYMFNKSVYTKSKEPVIVTCNIHGDFKTIPNRILNGVGCPKCGLEICKNSRRSNLNKFILRANKVHNKKYDYSKSIYKNIGSVIDIICPIHGLFSQKVRNHFSGEGCKQCGIISRANKRRSKKDYVILQFKKQHGDNYDYSDIVYIKSSKKVKIICKKHGEFFQSPNNHIRGAGCPICKESKGERKVRLWLKQHNIKFISQFKFKDCKFVAPLSFDFYLPDFNTCIEFDGKQHSKPLIWFMGKKRSKQESINSFEDGKQRDKIKDEYCERNGIKLIRLSKTYQINEYLSKTLGGYNEL